MEINKYKQTNHLQMHKCIGIICLPFGIDQCRLCQLLFDSLLHLTLTPMAYLWHFVCYATVSYDHIKSNAPMVNLSKISKNKCAVF